MKIWMILISVSILMIMTMSNAYATPRQAELILTDIKLEPNYPQAGDKVAIVGSLYNAGTVETNYYAKVVTGAFFVDGELRKIVELGNVQAGLSHKIDLSSDQFWDTEYGKHNMTLVIDYHNSIPDSYDDPSNNILIKTFDIAPFQKSKINFDISPQYVIPKKDLVITISGTLFDYVTDMPLQDQQVILNVGGIENTLATDKNGVFALTKAITFDKNGTIINATFSGKFPYLESTHQDRVYSLTTKTKSAFITKIEDPLERYNFKNLPSLIVIYQDSYQKIISKILTTDKGVLLDDNTALIELPPNHSYLQEVYVDGRFFFSSDWKKIEQDSIIQEKFYIPELAQIKFSVVDQNNNSVPDVTIKNWLYSAKTNQNGDTEWIDILPTRSKNEPYVALTNTKDGRIFKSEPFFVASGERKIIEIITNDSKSTIPSWIKDNAKWWSEDKISTSDFIKGIEYLIEQKLILVSQSNMSEGTKTVPFWLRDTVKWWSEDKISDGEFVQALDYLIKMGIIQI